MGRPVILAALALLLFGDGPAHAEPVTATISAYLIAAGVAKGVALVVASVITYAAVALASYAIQSALAPGQRRAPQSELIRDLARPQSLTPYRFAYGFVRLSGSPAPIHVQGRVLWMCLILNSRPSHAVTGIWFDKREFTWTGDIYDFDTGAVGTGDTFGTFAYGDVIARAWVGLGDQTTPPALAVSETGGVITESDGWQGRTVLWLRLDCGPNESRAVRWPRTPPEVEVQGQWSKVWDPSDVAQDPDDASTWTYSDNRTLCLLDALRTNPVRAYPLAQIDLPSFTAAAASDNGNVALKAGGTEPRYRASGVVIWGDNELEDQITPLVEAGASRLVRFGGRLGITRGIWDEPVYTVTDILDEGLTFETLKPGRDLATTVSASYMAPDRDWQMSALTPYQVPGAQEADGGLETIKDKQFSAVISYTQAQRLQKIDALRNRAQKRITCTLPPDAMDVVAGSNVTVDLPSPYAALNGIYEVISIAPRLIAEDDQGVTARCPVELVETSEAVFAWDAETDEVDPPEDPIVVTPEIPVVPVPENVVLITDAVISTGDTIIPALIAQVDFPTGNVEDALEVEWRPDGGVYQSAGQQPVDRVDPTTYVTTQISPVEAGTTYDVRVRWRAATGASEWVLVTGTAGSPTVDLDPPVDGDANVVGLAIAVEFRTPNMEAARGLEIWRSLTADSEDASLAFGPLLGAPNTLFGVTDSGVTAGTTYYYFGRTTGAFGSRSEFTAAVSATVPP